MAAWTFEFVFCHSLGETGRVECRQLGMTQPRPVFSNTTYLVTRRCLGRRFLLRPDAALNQLFLYTLALAAKSYDIEIHAVSVMSNHYHVVLTDRSAVLPLFMGWLNSQLAKGIKRLRDWDEVVWEPNVPFSAVALQGRAEMLDKVAYTLLNPVSAGLVHKPEEWPGVLSSPQNLQRGSMQVSRPKVWFRNELPEALTLRLTAPPLFTDQRSYLEALRALLASRLKALGLERSRGDRKVLGCEAVCATPFTARPMTPKEPFGRSPTFSALTRATWRKALERLRGFRAAYRFAYEQWRNGNRHVQFPPGTWWLARHAAVSVAI